MPTRSRSQVKTMAWPHIVVRNARDATARDMLARVIVSVVRWRRWKGVTHKSAGTGTPCVFAHPKIRGAWPVLANANSMRELP